MIKWNIISDPFSFMKKQGISSRIILKRDKMDSLLPPQSVVIFLL